MDPGILKYTVLVCTSIIILSIILAILSLYYGR